MKVTCKPAPKSVLEIRNVPNGMVFKVADGGAHLYLKVTEELYVSLVDWKAKYVISARKDACCVVLESELVVHNG